MSTFHLFIFVATSGTLALDEVGSSEVDVRARIEAPRTALWMLHAVLCSNNIHKNKETLFLNRHYMP